jgi:hypothetical protein
MTTSLSVEKAKYVRALMMHPKTTRVQCIGKPYWKVSYEHMHTP